MVLPLRGQLPRPRIDGDRARRRGRPLDYLPLGAAIRPAHAGMDPRERVADTSSSVFSTSNSPPKLLHMDSSRIGKGDSDGTVKRFRRSE